MILLLMSYKSIYLYANRDIYVFCFFKINKRNINYKTKYIVNIFNYEKEYMCRINAIDKNVHNSLK